MHVHICFQIASDEAKHVAFLRSALGAAAVDQPLLNINAAFNAAMAAAFGTVEMAHMNAPKPVKAGLNPHFNAYKSDYLFLLSAFLFEDVGVTAYKV